MARECCLLHANQGDDVPSIGHQLAINWQRRVDRSEWIATNHPSDFPLNQKMATLTMTALESNQSNVCS
jgi:hypothetical protein